MSEKSYKAVRACKCGYKEEIYQTKIEAAFGNSSELWERVCPKCGKSQTDYISGSQPEIDAELFKIWSENEDFQFSEQDEDLLLADMEHLEMLLSALDDDNFPEGKKAVVVEALCTLLFDNLKLDDKTYTAEETQQMQANKTIILPELQKRKDNILPYREVVWDYIWEEVEPALLDE